MFNQDKYNEIVDRAIKLRDEGKLTQDDVTMIAQFIVTNVKLRKKTIDAIKLMGMEDILQGIKYDTIDEKNKKIFDKLIEYKFIELVGTNRFKLILDSQNQ